MRGQPSSQKRSSVDPKRIMERFSLPENELMPRKSDNPAQRNQFPLKTIRGRESLNPRRDPITSPFSKNSIDPQNNRSPLLKDFEDFRAEYKSMASNSRADQIRRNQANALRKTEITHAFEAPTMPSLLPTNKNSRRTHVEEDNSFKFKELHSRASVNLKTSYTDSNMLPEAPLRVLRVHGFILLGPPNFSILK